MDDIKDKMAHLTNNSVQKQGESFDEDSSMLHSDDFQEWLKEENSGSDIWKNKIQPAMKKASVLALKGAQGASGLCMSIYGNNCLNPRFYSLYPRC